MSTDTNPNPNKHQFAARMLRLGVDIRKIPHNTNIVQSNSPIFPLMMKISKECRGEQMTAEEWDKMVEQCHYHGGADVLQSEPQIALEPFLAQFEPQAEKSPLVEEMEKEKSPVNGKKIFLPILDNGNGDVKANWAICLFGGLQVGLNVKISRASDSHAGRGMNKVANDFLESDCTHMLIIDADIHFSQDHIRRLLSHDLPLVYGVYPLKEENPKPCTAAWPTGHEFDKPCDENGLLHVRRSGRGFMLVSRGVFEKLRDEKVAPPYYNHGKTEFEFFKSGVVKGNKSARFDHTAPWTDQEDFHKRFEDSAEWISEDWYFCEDCRSIGIKTYVDTTVHLAHEGSRVYRFNPADIKPIKKEVKTWRDIDGWFSEEDAKMYHYIAQSLPVDGRFVEVGSWQGRSFGLMHSLTRDKSPKLFAVDTFKGSPLENVHTVIVEANGGTIRHLFDANMRAIGATDFMVDELPSIEAAAQWEPQTLDAVFIDGAHDYFSVRQDIAAWLPKIKPGGIIAGHDINETDVIKAVIDSFGCAEDSQKALEESIPAKQCWKTIGNCWYYELPKE